MKKIPGIISIFITFLLLGFIPGCDGGSSPEKKSSGLMSKVTTIFQEAIPSAPSGSKSWTLDFDLDLDNDTSLEDEDSYIYRYLADDINGVYLNSEIYDLIADLVNSKVDESYNPAAGVTVTEATGFATDCLGTGTITGSFHDLDMGDNIVTLSGPITMRNIRIIIEKTATTERVYAYLDVYDGETQFDAILYTCIIDFSADTVNFEIHSYEADDSEGSDFKKQLAITKNSDDNFTIKELSGSTGDVTFNKAIVVGNLTNAYIRCNDECFLIDCSDFSKLLPSGNTGTAEDWTDGFPEEVTVIETDDFYDYALDTSIVSADSLKWWLE